jgi:hypothetical protein
MLNTALLPRPWSGHRPRVPHFAPTITSQVVRVARGRNAWRCQVLVDGAAMCTSHHRTKREAESMAQKMMEVYCTVHYESR